MFRIISLKVYEHPFLGTIKDGLEFIPKTEISNNQFPYSSVLIGPNGTGKSSLLALIAEIFEDLKRKTDKPKYISRVKFKYEIVYTLQEQEYLVAYNYKINPKNKRKIDEYTFVKNRDAAINVSELPIPNRIMAVSYLTMDRFRAKKNEKQDFYLYLGLRDRSNAARARTFINNSLPMLFEFIKEEGSIDFIKRILNFLGLNQEYLGVSFEYRYKGSFFTGEMTPEQFESLFETYSSFSGRTDTPYGVTYYDANVRGNKKLINRLVNFINIRTFQDVITVGKKSYFDINLLENSAAIEDLELVNHLRRLDLMSTASFMFKKGVEQPFDLDEASSGEFHFLTTMIAIQSGIANDSLVLIDEPETSFHPNWQMKYIHTLKDIFKKWNTTHFIMSTHSHFLVSDLEPNSSEVIGLSGTVGHLKAKPFKISTYGWTSDEILYRVFKVRTNRNHFFEYDITRLAYLIENKSTNIGEVKSLIDKLSDYRFSDKDPLTVLIQQGKKLVEKDNG